MAKSPGVETFLNDLASSLFSRERDGKSCVMCGSKKVEPSDFKNEISRKEWKISYMCQACQDKMFEQNEEF